MVFAEEMAKQKEGAIVNFSSESALRPLTRVVGYGAAKAAISNFTKYMAGELALKFGPGLRVNAIAHTPFGRLGEPEELVGTIQYLISDASKFVSGTVAIVDGGFDAFSI